MRVEIDGVLVKVRHVGLALPVHVAAIGEGLGARYLVGLELAGGAAADAL